MIELDVAGLVVIAARTLAISTDAALSAMDIRAAQAALAEAQFPGSQPGAALPDRDAAAAAGVYLVHALLRHRPFPRQTRQVAVAAGLQVLALNGWRADLNPLTTTVVVIDALASGQFAVADATAWLSQRLSPVPQANRAPRLRALPAARRPGPRLTRHLPAPPIRALAGTLAVATAAGVAALATACSRAPDMSSAATARPHYLASTSQETSQARSVGLAYAACLRSHGIREFPRPSPGEAVAIAPGTRIDPVSPLFRQAERACQAITPAANS